MSSKLSVARPIDEEARVSPEQLTKTRGETYRSGKPGLTVYFPMEAFAALHDAQILRRMETGARVSKSDILHEALDDWFERQGLTRYFGTRPSA